MEEGLSRLKLAIKALDDQFRPEQPWPKRASSLPNRIRWPKAG